MPHSPEKLLKDIEISIQEIEDFSSGRCYKDFLADRLLQAGIERELEIIGEALHRLERIDNERLQTRIPEYRQIIGLRNIIAHGYDIIDLDSIWDVIQNHIPMLKEKIGIY